MPSKTKSNSRKKSKKMTDEIIHVIYEKVDAKTTRQQLIRQIRLLMVQTPDMSNIRMPAARSHIWSHNTTKMAFPSKVCQLW
jgi:hypothetical protein